MIRAIVASIITSTLLLSPFFATSVLSLTLVQNLTSRTEQQCVLTLEADGNGQTYIVCKNGYKYPTGQVSRETGDALAEDNMWIGMTGEDLATIPTRGTVYEHPALAGELPDEYKVDTEVVQQGIYGTCVAFSITQAAEYVYWEETGIPIQFSELQLFTEAGGTDIGVSIHAANRLVKTTGLVEAYHRPYDPTPWTYEAEYMAPMSIEAQRYRFQAHTVAGLYTGTESQVEALKKGVLTYGPLAFGIDTVKDWNEGAEYPEGREYTANHQALIVGWSDEGWIVRNSYGEDEGILLFNYPLLWVFGYEML